MTGSPLRYAVRFRVLARYLGQLLLVLAVLGLPPLAVALMLGDAGLAGRQAAVSAALAGAGLPLSRIRTSERVQANEAMVLVAAVFLLAALAAWWPLAGAGLSALDGLFEAISGVTTTGLTTVSSPGSMSRGFLFARAWTQWYGGLGIVALSLALVVRPGPAARDLAATEGRRDDLAGSTREHARRVLQVYVGLTVVAYAMAVLSGVAPFAALCYTLSAVSTGGFTPLDGSLAPLGLLARWGVMLACFAGALPLVVLDPRRRGRRDAAEVLQCLALAGAVAAVTLVLGATLHAAGASWGAVARDAPLLALTAQTGAGFSPADGAGLDSASRLVLLGSMLIGGGVGSTSGGIKLLRLLTAVAVCRAVLARLGSPPRAVTSPRLGGRRLDGDEIGGALVVALLFLAVVVASWLPFLLLGYAPLDALFEVVSAVATVGLSSGLTGPDLPSLLKGVLCVDMLLGRLEVVAWLVVLDPGTWLGRRRRVA